jgi:predicted nucleic acid-binding protein
MITYFDTSALVKKYNLEDNSDKVIETWNNSESVVTSTLTYAEIMAVFGRKYQDKLISKKEYTQVIKSIDSDWKTMTLINISEELFDIIKTKTKAFYLRGFDAVLLSSAIYYRDSLIENHISFACFDKQLNSAAEKGGFLLIGQK